MNNPLTDADLVELAEDAAGGHLFASDVALSLIVALRDSRERVRKLEAVAEKALHISDKVETTFGAALGWQVAEADLADLDAVLKEAGYPVDGSARGVE